MASRCDIAHPDPADWEPAWWHTPSLDLVGNEDFGLGPHAGGRGTDRRGQLLGSRGSASRRSAITLRTISSLPPPSRDPGRPQTTSLHAYSVRTTSRTGNLPGRVTPLGYGPAHGELRPQPPRPAPCQRRERRPHPRRRHPVPTQQTVAAERPFEKRTGQLGSDWIPTHDALDAWKGARREQ